MIWPVCLDRLEIRKCPQVLVAIPFHWAKQLRAATLFYFFLLSGAPFLLLWMNREMHNNKAFIKSAAKPSTTKEHNIWGRWVIPLLHLEAGAEFQMSIITAGDGREGDTQTGAQIHTYKHSRTVRWWKQICYWPSAHCGRAGLKCPSLQNVTLYVFLKPISSQTLSPNRSLTI